MIADNIKLIVKLCPNYDLITTYECEKEDYFTQNLINYYNDYLNGCDFKNILEQERIERFDKSVGEYLTSYKFEKKVQEHFTFEEDTNDLVEDINSLYDDYEEEKLNETQTSRWL